MAHQYKKEDFRPVSWEEYGQTLEALYQKVNKHLIKNKIKIDAIVPIYRAGAIPAAYLASKLGILRILPVQYKYFFKGNDAELKKIYGFSKKNVELPKSPTFLLVEGDHCFGLTAETAAKDLKKEFPSSRIIYAADHMDYSYQKNKYAEVIFYGKLTNECRELSVKKCREKGVENPVSYLLPYLVLEEEYETTQGKQYQYKDLDEVLNGSETKEVIDISEIFEKEQ